MQYLRKHLFHVALFVLVGSFGSGVCAYGAGTPQQNGYGQAQDQAGWDVPPPGMTQVQADGFRTGILAAQDDINQKLQPNASNRPEYKNPPKMSFLQRVMYRDGFTKGYQRVMDRFYGVPQPPPPPPPPAYVPPPPAYVPPPVEEHRYRSGHDMEYKHQGFQDGMVGALHDMEHNRRSDPGNRDEFRQPRVPGEAAEFYREGFRRGYSEAMSALTDGPNGIVRGSSGDMMMRAYHEGAASAIRDFDGRRQADPSNHDEFRSPGGPPQQREEYRNSFRRGYQRIAGQIFGDGDRR